MASRIKGITIEIGGNTTKLESALKSVNKTIYSTNSELNDLNKALKLDPKNTELLAQKQDVLKKNIEATAKKLSQLITAQKQMGSYSNLTEEQKEQYRALSVEITKSESALKNLKKELKATSGINLENLSNSLKKVGDVAGQVFTKVTQVASVVGAALTAVIGAGVKSYGEYEQQLGGIEAMFDKTTASGKKAFDEVSKTGENAWKDLTMSATDYYKTFSSTYTLVKNSIQDQEKAIDTTNKMIKLESDLSNTFGYDIETAANAINWALKGSFNYIDNLNLGIKGTKEGFLEAAQSCGYMVDSVDELSSDQILDVLTQYADKFGVIDRTSREASGTIQGSVKSMKAAFDNFINGSGSPDDLADSFLTAFENIVKVIDKIAPKILKGIVKVVEKIMPTIINTLVNEFPTLINSALSLLQQLVDYIAKNTQPIVKMVTTVINNIVMFILNNLPTIFKAGLEILISLVNGIAENLDTIIPAIVDCVLTMVDTLVDNIDLLIDAAEKLIIGLAEGLVKAIPKLIEKVPVIIAKLVKAFLELRFKFLEIGSNILQGILDGLTNIGHKIKDAVSNVGEKIKQGFCDFFGIHSPSRLMSNEVGLFVGEGVTEGIIKGLEETENKVNRAMKELAGGIETSVNPTINPTANTNPLIIQIENFNNNSESDIQELAQKLEFYRKNSSLARGGN